MEGFSTSRCFLTRLLRRVRVKGLGFTVRPGDQLRIGPLLSAWPVSSGRRTQGFSPKPFTLTRGTQTRYADDLERLGGTQVTEQTQQFMALLAATKTLFEYIAAEHPQHCAGLSGMLQGQSDRYDKAGMHIAAEHLRGIQASTLSEAAADQREQCRKLLAAPPKGSA